MNTTITARHCDISDELRARAAAVVTRLAGLVARPVESTVVFDMVGQLARAEIRLKGGRGEDFLATAQEKDHRTALDRAEDKIRRQLEKAAAPRRAKGARDAV
jgi:ribosomal subunit interface protein